MKILSSVAISVALAINFTPIQAFSQDPFAEMDSEFAEYKKAGSRSEMNEFQKWKKSYLAEFADFRKAHFKRVDKRRDQLISKWGDSEVSTKAQFVDYSKDESTKTVLDFEKGEIRVSIIHDENKKIDSSVVEKALVNLSVQSKTKKDDVLQSLVGSKVDGNAIKNLVEHAVKKIVSTAIAINESAVVQKQIKLIKEQGRAQKSNLGRVFDQMVTQGSKQPSETTVIKNINDQQKQIDKETLQRIAKYKAQSKRLDKSKAKRRQLSNKKITTFTMPLANKKDLVKAKPFIAEVKNQSSRWNLEPSLMLAIMHTESYFNPKAQSHVPAYGLMQIVPRTAGVDVNRFLYKKDKPMAKSYLVKANENIETGVAYMNILNTRYLRKITDPLSRMYCMIAAYNTGAGNVAKTFNRDNSRNINRAAKIINSMTPAQVYNRLIKHLPYEETQNYVKRVVKRKKIYAPVDSI
ncbi:MAG: hypothetical protein COA86_08600 [Kangiella sp.]|nr:MAG: hypothetical protein COA86_08600 [Kangiella sp.]